MSKLDPETRLRHMMEHAELALKLAEGQSRDELDSDPYFSLALTRAVELIGEAASQVPQEVRTSAPEIDWPAIINMRHRLIHAYHEVDLDVLWDTVQNDIPELIPALRDLLDELEQP